MEELENLLLSTGSVRFFFVWWASRLESLLSGSVAIIKSLHSFFVEMDWKDKMLVIALEESKVLYLAQRHL